MSAAAVEFDPRARAFAMVAAGQCSERDDADTGEIIDPAPTPLNLPATFWQERPELAHIRDAAHSATGAADAVLGAVLARVAALTPPSLRLPSPVSRGGTLDLCVAKIGSSGSGKSGADAVAAELVPLEDPNILEAAGGTGEGIEASYFGPVVEPDENGKNQKVKRQVRTSFLATWDEGQMLAEIGNRSGSTLMQTIRSAWSGQRLGKQNASDETTRQLAPGSYRFVLLVSFQTELATALLDDAAGGTPQRFVFVAAEDPSIPDVAPAWPGVLKVTLPRHQHGEQMGLAVEVATEIRASALARSRGEIHGDPLDSHRDLSRLKVAGLLAIMAGRKNITGEDWRLSGDVLDASDRVRGRIIEAARWRAMEYARTRSAGLATQAAYLDDSATERALASMARSIARHVHKGACEGGCKRRCATQSTAGPHRQLVTIDDAIEAARGRGWVCVDGEQIHPGEVTP